MQHIAIDLGGMKSQFCIRSAKGEIVGEGKISTHRLTSLFKKNPPSVVILETCAEAFKVAEQAEEFKHDVRIVPATLAPSLGVGARRTKTDQRDGRALSLASCRIELPSVHLRSKQSRMDKMAYKAREALVTSRTKIINTARGWLRTELLTVSSGRTESFPDRVRCMAQHQGFKLPPPIERLLTICETITEQIKEADRDLVAQAKSDQTCQRMMTVPGVGPVTAIRFRAALDDISRFETAHSVESYLGLTPGERSSSNTKRRLGITKAGSADVRRLLVQCAWSYWRNHRDEPMGQWVEKIAERRGRSIACVALARKLAGILYALWRDGNSYDATRAAAPVGAHAAPPRELPAAAVKKLLSKQIV
jgi:transposase